MCHRLIVPRGVVVLKSVLQPTEHAADDEPGDAGVVHLGKARADLVGVAGHGVVEGRAGEADGGAGEEGEEDERLVPELTEGEVDGDEGREERRANEVGPDVGRLVVHAQHRVEAEREGAELRPVSAPYEFVVLIWMWHGFIDKYTQSKYALKSGPLVA